MSECLRVCVRVCVRVRAVVCVVVSCSFVCLSSFLFHLFLLIVIYWFLVIL